MISDFNNFAIKAHNSFSIDVYAKKFVQWEDFGDLVNIFIDNPPSKWIALGGGNNTLFCGDYDGVILNGVCSNIAITSQDKRSVGIRVDAGVEWDDLVEWACQRGYWGVENLSLIPGHCGAAPIQNIGAYGVELKDVVKSVEMFHVENKTLSTVSVDECRFGYRDSIFKRELRGKVIITAIHLTLSKVPQPNLGYKDVEAEIALLGEVTLLNIRQAICNIRERKLPSTKEFGNAGSFFKNPVVELSKAEELKKMYPDIPLYPVPQDSGKVKLAAGWLIDKAGFKGYREGRVGVHDKQALVIINIGGATGEEILALARKIEREVASLFGVSIEMEVNIVL
ncbi:MAG: UDP-N-acetylmuramate dehydrogenase [Rikenellaceae bacterium]